MQVVNIRKAKPGTFIYIGRGSIYGNPYTHLPLKGTKAQFQVATRDEAIDKYEEYARHSPLILGNLHKLIGYDLACFCAPKRCHGGVLLKLIQERYGGDDHEVMALQGLLRTS